MRKHQDVSSIYKYLSEINLKESRILLLKISTPYLSLRIPFVNIISEFWQCILRISKACLAVTFIFRQNSAIIMTNGIRNVRQGLDIFDKRILDFCRFISDRYLYMELTSWCLHIEPDSIERIYVFSPGIRLLHNSSPGLLLRSI